MAILRKSFFTKLKKQFGLIIRLKKCAQAFFPAEKNEILNQTYFLICPMLNCYYYFFLYLLNTQNYQLKFCRTNPLFIKTNHVGTEHINLKI